MRNQLSTNVVVSNIPLANMDSEIASWYGKGISGSELDSFFGVVSKVNRRVEMARLSSKSKRGKSIIMQ